MNNYFDRQKWLIDKFAKGQPFTFAKLSNISNSTFQGYISERIPKPEHLLRIHEFCGVNLHWLLTGEGEALTDDGTQKIETIVLDEDISLKAMKLLTNILTSKSEIYIKAMMSNLVAFDDALRSGRGKKAEMPQGMVLIEDRRESGERRKNPDPDWPVEKELRQGGDRRKAGLG